MHTVARQTIQCSAPAKVNLSLAVLGRRADGFHDLESWVVRIHWFDRLTLTTGDELSLCLVGDAGDTPTGAANLVWQAAEVLARAAGRRPGVAATLEKSIPTGSGLGGASSDAAATLLGLNRLWNLNWPIERLMPPAAEIGSDVPLFLDACNSAVIRGRGERVEPMSTSWLGWLVLIVPPFRLSTAAVYEAFAQLASKRSEHSAPWLCLPCTSEALLPRLFNDLEAAAFTVEPRLARLHAAVDGLDGRLVRMTGSGSALFTLFDEAAQAEAWRRAALARLGRENEVRVVFTAPASQSAGRVETHQ